MIHPNTATNFVIREAQPDDAAAIIVYIQRIAEEPNIDIVLGPGEFNLTVEQEQRILADFAAADNSLFLVAEADEQIVGVLSCRGGQRRAVQHTTTLGMTIARDWRDRGIGKALMARTIAWARQSGVVRRIELHVYERNARARHLYETFGFEIEGRRRRSIFRDGAYHDDLLMALLLDKD
jgi:RimJ/RimL family protein N-acetyltransferase